jgi:hypothetical protein
MTKTVLPMVLLALASCVSVSGIAFAQGDAPNYSMEDVTACSPDAMRLCKDKLPDVDAIESCMKANYENLRPACKARFEHSH